MALVTTQKLHRGTSVSSRPLHVRLLPPPGSDADHAIRQFVSAVSVMLQCHAASQVVAFPCCAECSDRCLMAHGTNVDEAALMLRLTRSALLCMLRAGELQGKKFAGRGWRMDRRYVAQLAREQQLSELLLILTWPRWW